MGMSDVGEVTVGDVAVELDVSIALFSGILMLVVWFGLLVLDAEVA